ncbi:hypothetical protein AB3Y40_02665 [Yoonia sp. R2331]|uniref:hypothetical protein n=1 Tax=Yoonia sp. R2331 TaxID=3237238 RepID=UPI0034E3D5C1
MKSVSCVLAAALTLSACGVPDQNRFRPLMEPERVQAVQPTDAFVNTFFRVCLDNAGRSSTHRAAAMANGFSQLAMRSSDSFIANSDDGTQALVLIAELTGYRCSLDDLTRSKGAATIAAFRAAAQQAGATPTTGGNLQISVKPILNSGDVLFYDLKAVRGSGGLSLILENQS